jgi:hypothetical protein
LTVVTIAKYIKYCILVYDRVIHVGRHFDATGGTMNFGSLAVKALLVIVLLFLLSLAGAIIFPDLAALTSSTGSGIIGLLLLIAAILVLAVIGSLLGRGIRSIKKPVEVLLLSFVGAFFMGAALALFAVLNIPFAIRVNLSWLGTSWYSPLLALLFIGTPLMLIFLVAE